jgi:hypothetical protein
MLSLPRTTQVRIGADKGLKSLRTQLITQYKQGIIHLSLVTGKIKIKRRKEKENYK